MIRICCALLLVGAEIQRQIEKREILRPLARIFERILIVVRLLPAHNAAVA
jgi:hypothetical protein